MTQRTVTSRCVTATVNTETHNHCSRRSNIAAARNAKQHRRRTVIGALREHFLRIQYREEIEIRKTCLTTISRLPKQMRAARHRHARSSTNRCQERLARRPAPADPARISCKLRKASGKIRKPMQQPAVLSDVQARLPRWDQRCSEP